MSAGSWGGADTDREAGRATPGAHLRAELRRLGLDQVAVSKATGVSRQSVNNIINGRQPISRAMAGKLGRLTGHSSDYWLSESFGEGSPAPYTADAAPRIAGAGLLVNHQIARAAKDGIIGIKPFVAENLRAASIELTLHTSVGTANGMAIDIGHAKGFELAAGVAVHASTVESIDLPRDYLGRIGAAAALCRHGIVASTALHIEPGFKGRLHFHLFNAGGSPFPLRAGAPVIALEILRLAVTPDDTGMT
jgi:deoxycytidine triphosphate deaminase/addiction module HigA family antidote